jgi:hypothetical protein
MLDGPDDDLANARDVCRPWRPDRDRLLIGKESFEAAVCTLIGLQHGSSGLSTEQLSAREDAIKLFTRAFRNRNAVQLDDGRVVWTEAAAVL